MRIATILMLCLILPLSASAQKEVELGIKTTHAEQIPLSITPFRAVDGARPDHATTLEQLIAADLEFSGIFKITRGQVSPPKSGRGADLVEVRGVLKIQNGETHFEGVVVDAANKLTIGGKRYVIKPKQMRQIAHHFADEIVRMLTGEPGIASTRVLYRRKTNDMWEIVMSDYDGYNPRVLLKQSVLVVYPRWVDESKGLIFTSFRKNKGDLYLRYLKEPASKPLLSFKGLNYSADWSARKKQLVATLSKDGNAELYIIDKNGKVKKRITHNRSIDCSPSWSPSGREIAFTSDRSGTPQVYIIQSDGSNGRRLTYHGAYNESPAWSPKGDRIVFVSRIGGFFQLCTIRPDGRDYKQITREAVDHEDPRWAPNGRHIILTEKRGYENVISIIDIYTGGKRILSQGDSPDWSIR